MANSSVEVYWRHGDLSCALRSTERGWEVVLTGPAGDSMRSERVTSGELARQVAERWRQDDIVSGRWQPAPLVDTRRATGRGSDVRRKRKTDTRPKS